MSTCSDVCFDGDFGYYNEFFAEATRTAVKEHKCGECGRAIMAGESYERAAGKCEGYWFTAKTCPECVEIRGALMCGQYFYQQVWEDIREHVYPRLLDVGPSECFAELKSKAARDKLGADFNEWASHETGV